MSVCHPYLLYFIFSLTLSEDRLGLVPLELYFIPTSITREAEGKGLKIKVGLANILNQSLETKEQDGERQIQSISSRKETKREPDYSKGRIKSC